MLIKCDKFFLCTKCRKDEVKQSYLLSFVFKLLVCTNMKSDQSVLKVKTSFEIFLLL